jgi:hypothetical protein
MTIHQLVGTTATTRSYPAFIIMDRRQTITVSIKEKRISNVPLLVETVYAQGNCTGLETRKNANWGVKSAYPPKGSEVSHSFHELN